MARAKRVKSHDVSETQNIEKVNFKSKWLFFKIAPKWLLIVFAVSITIFIIATVLLIHFYL